MSFSLFLNRHPKMRSALAGPRALRRSWHNWREEPVTAVLNRISETVKGNIIFEVREFDGVFCINPRSHLLNRVLRYGYYEPAVAQLFAAHVRPDADIVDVGANVGFFTVSGAKKLTTGRLLAAEPTTEAHNRLRENVARNGVAEKVILFKGMVGSVQGQAEIHFVPGLEEYSSMKNPEHFATTNQEIQKESVPIDTLDHLVNLHGLRPALMKVDAEGAEYSVFQGAHEVLMKHRPVVFSEIWRERTTADGHSGQELVEMFERIDYVVKDPNDPQAIPGSKMVGEIICIPKEKYHPGSLQ
jgi:FkbM family methyltransferase